MLTLYLHHKLKLKRFKTFKTFRNFQKLICYKIAIESYQQPDDLIIINKNKRTCKIMDFAVPVDHRVKLKESEKKDKYLDLARELKKLWNMKVTFIPIVIGVLGTVTEGLLKELEDLEIR